MINRRIGSVWMLGLALVATGTKFVLVDLEPISDCSFKTQKFLCEEKAPIQIDEQRGLRNFPFTTSSDISVPLTGQQATFS